MSVLPRLFNKKRAAASPDAAAPPQEQAAIEPAAPPPMPRESAAPRPLVVTEETLGLSDEIPKTRLPEHEPVAHLDVIAPEHEAELKALQQYRQTAGYQNFMQKAKRPPIDGPRRLNIPEEYGGAPNRRKP